mmetsp:Transcript_7936/g.14466  ORF Transcript_7936/g.14466 Transcript_7936/m.14466 type:complete len:155 (+) Transcript_7936:1268-1732(+)
MGTKNKVETEVTLRLEILSETKSEDETAETVENMTVMQTAIDETEVASEIKNEEATELTLKTEIASETKSVVDTGATMTAMQTEITLGIETKIVSETKSEVETEAIVKTEITSETGIAMETKNEAETEIGDMKMMHGGSVAVLGGGSCNGISWP